MGCYLRSRICSYTISQSSGAVLSDKCASLSHPVCMASSSSSCCCRCRRPLSGGHHSAHARGWSQISHHSPSGRPLQCGQTTQSTLDADRIFSKPHKDTYTTTQLARLTRQSGLVDYINNHRTHTFNKNNKHICIQCHLT